jgi:hypothetical protein
MPTVPPRLTLFFILPRNDPHPTAVVPFLFFLNVRSSFCGIIIPNPFTISKPFFLHNRCRLGCAMAETVGIKLEDSTLRVGEGDW